MRTAFAKTLEKVAVKNKDIMLIVGDLGFSVFEDYMRRFPKQYLNAGIAEQNMTGIAAGMAMEGKTPLIYSIIPFASMRNFEQIKNDICYQNLNVKIVGVGAGFSYGPYGHTHYGLEDLSVLRALPNMTIFSPADPVEAELVTKAAFELEGPVYIRIGKSKEPTIHLKKPTFKIGKGIVLKGGADVSIIATGTMVPIALQASDILKRQCSVAVISMPTIKPLDKDLIIESAKNTKNLFSLEEHFITGGLGTAIAEVLAEEGISCNFKRLGVKDAFSKVTGSQDFMRSLNGLLPNQLVKTIEKVVGDKNHL